MKFHILFLQKDLRQKNIKNIQKYSNDIQKKLFEYFWIFLDIFGYVIF